MKNIKKYSAVCIAVLMLLALILNTGIIKVYAVEDICCSDQESIGHIHQEALIEQTYLSVHYADGTMGALIDESYSRSESVNETESNVYEPMSRSPVLLSGKPDNESIVAVFLAEGFTANEQQDFLDRVTSIANYMVTVKPFSLYKDYLTVIAVHTISDQSGISGERNGEFACLTNGYPTTPECTPEDGIFNCTHGVNTFFNSYFGWRSNPGREVLEMRGDDRYRARIFAQQYGSPSVNMIQVLANSKLHGGTGAMGELGVAITSIESAKTDDDWKQVVMHEFGHSFGGLWDEYWNALPGNEYPNMTSIDYAASPKWGAWIGYEGIGAYPFDKEEIEQYPEAAYWLRPHQKCLMRQTRNTVFCAVCSDELIRRMGLITAVPLFTTANDGSNIQINNVNVTLRDEFKIPPVYNGKRVTKIGSLAFANQVQVQSIIIPSTVTLIGDSAFSGCTNLNSIGIPYNVTNVDSNVFLNCNQLTIYAEAASKPSGWHTNWNSSNRLVNWNKCSICTVEISQSITGTGHSLVCTNGHPIISGSHNLSYTIQSNNHIKKCTVCSYEVPEAHSYNHHYGKYNNNQHYAYCICNSSILASHTITQAWWSGSSQYGTCGQCNDTILIHTCSYSYDYYSSTYHTVYCSCGESTLASHTFNSSGTCTKCWYNSHTCSYTSSYNYYSNTYHTAICSCGLSTLASHTFNASGTCTKCWFQTHTHSYTDSYIYYSSTQHLAYCSCGTYNLYSHKFHPIIGYCTNCGYNPLIIMRSESEVET